MSPVESNVGALAAWTPYLAGGFAWNIVISCVALVSGLALGFALALLRLSSCRVCAWGGQWLTGVSRNVPTFVFQYYLIFMLPNGVPLPFVHLILPIPAWLKAALALALAVAGFTSDNLLHPLGEWRAGSTRGARLFVSHLANYFVVIVMASSTASVIGVPELVSRCNTMINALGRSDAMLWIYLYAMAWFCIFSLTITAVIPTLYGRATYH
ncbi:polar amino acid ABC transporter permease [Trinickia diaoshuihuensis]|uniref:polar amino acid ABC transporter permease n=1 Tax=Trinickia diaoshuihuensis TaxID=2292265 RepID=UPI000E24A5E8|nr:polar amino acid ABC transporter permease [Trinickia diaoshuihuensis]